MECALLCWMRGEEFGDERYSVASLGFWPVEMRGSGGARYERLRWMRLKG